jgi:hypothetical protein
VIRSRNPRIDAAALEARVDEALAGDGEPGNDDRLARLSATVHARTIESELQTAEARSIPRAAWPPDLRVPLVSASGRLQRLALRVMALAFRDQHEANAALIRAQREMLALVQTLTERVEALETQLEAERAAARAQRIARRQNDEA